MSGAGCACAIVVAIDQMFSFAASIRPDMLLVVSSTNTTSTLGRPDEAIGGETGFTGIGAGFGGPFACG